MIVDIEADPRVAGEINRYHTWRVHRRQSVGEHSWQIARIMITIWPECPRRLLVHSVLHDVGEMTGDLPYPAKKNDPVLKERMTLAELRVHREMTKRWCLPEPVKLSVYEATFFKLCEYLEMWEFGLSEQNLGNRYAAVVAVRMLLAASTLMGKLREARDRGDPDLDTAIRSYTDTRKKQESETDD